jgi:signal transduction histidine kinase
MPSSSTSSNLILIVEDEAVIAMDLQMQLQDMGYRVQGIARSGAQALSLAAQQRPDLVLMDIRIKGEMDGVQTAEQLRGEDAPPVVFLTSHHDEQTVARAAQTAPYGFVTKPFLPRALRATIEMALARASLERRLAAEQRQVAALQAREAAQQELLARASHEMRTPLNAVMGFSQLLGMLGNPEPHLVQHYAHNIERAGGQLLSLVENLLDLQQLGAAPQLPLDIVPLELGASVASAPALLEPQAQARRVSVHAAVPLGLRVLADAVRLEQVLVNLADNAIKFNHEGGSLWVQAQADDASRVRITLTDNGQGIEQEQLQRLFQPFSRAGREHSPIAGAGLGLLTTRALVQAMGGTLQLSSTHAQGTVVTVELPLAP